MAGRPTRQKNRARVKPGITIAYMCDVDISQPDGPGVNEREFVWSLQTESELRGDQAFFLIPKPSKQLNFTLRNVEYYQKKFVRKNSFVAFRILSTTWHLLKLVSKKLKRTNIDLFVIRLNINSILVSLFLLLFGRKYAIKTLGNLYSFHKDEVSIMEKIYFWPLRKILGGILRNAVFVDVCTPQLYENYRNKYSLNNIEIIENSVNVKHFYIRDIKLCKKKCGLQKFDKIVGYCGGYPSSRGGRQLVEISSRLVETYHDCGILIIGDDSDLDLLREKAKQLGTHGHIIFKGIVDYGDLHFYMNCLDVGIALDEEKVQFVGNCSQKIRQYLACGVPIICPDSTNKNIIGEKLGLSVVPNNLDQIFDAVSFWFDKSIEERQQIRVKCSNFAKKNLSTEVSFEYRYAGWRSAMEKT